MTIVLVARLLLAAAAAGAVACVAAILALSADPLRASPWLVAFSLSAVGFVLAARQLRARPVAAALTAVGAALTLATVGALAAFGAAFVALPAAALGVAAAWAVLLHPPRRSVVVALVGYVVVGLAILVVGGEAVTVPPLGSLTLPIWPVLLIMFLGPEAWLGIYALLAGGLALMALGLLRAAPRQVAGHTSHRP